MAKKKILIAYANAGAGHRKAALAIEGAFKEINPSDVETKVIDTLDYSTKLLRKGYPATYIFLVNRIPTFWGLCYYLFDSGIVYRTIISPARRINNFLNCRGLVNFLSEYNPDVIINTHFLGNEVMADMRRRGKLKATRIITCVTDYLPHLFWVDKTIDYYCVAQEESKIRLIERGIPSERISVFGIPIDRVFAIRKGKKELCAKLGIREGLRNVLIGSGGFGVGPVKELVKEISGIQKNIQLLVVCGKNPKLYREIGGWAKSLEVSVKVYEFVDNMDELMEISDVMVTKSGGMTSSEALAKDLPLVITSAIPGQEAMNSNFLVKSGAAVYAGSIKRTKHAILDILDSEDNMKKIKENIARVKRPNASYDIARFALDLLKSTGD